MNKAIDLDTDQQTTLTELVAKLQPDGEVVILKIQAGGETCADVTDPPAWREL